MNILTSYKWIQEYLDTDLSAKEFAAATTNAGNSVERIDRSAEKFDKMVVGVVKKIEKHPNADRLSVVTTDIGTRSVQIVCGGQNLAKGQRVAVTLPGAKVLWHGQGDLVELKKVKVRGVESYGMICAAREIGFESLPQVELDIWDLSEITDAKAGTPLAKALELEDSVFDIEVTSNRPDCRSIVGQAREGAAVTGAKFTWKAPTVSTSSKHKVDIEVKESDLCPKYSAILIENVKVGPSPWWMQKKLVQAGFKPINNIVDITNYVLHEYGQPLHTFDVDKLKGEKIIVRKAKKNEKFLALDGNEYKLSSDQLVIADEKRAVAVAGVMGGEETGTTKETTRVLIESATFDPVSVRRTSRALNLYSDSQLLFEKGLSVESTGPALARAVELILELAGGHVASQVTSEEAAAYKPIMFDFEPDKVNQLLGIELKEKEMVGILERLGFSVKGKKITVPYWRDQDIENHVDFAEEIGRVHGYQHIPSILPQGDLSSVVPDPALTWKRRLKDMLAGAGLTETYSYAFVSEKQLALFDTKRVVKLKNPLNSEQEYMRPSLVPSMLTTIRENQNRFSAAELFELAPVYKSQKGDLPEQIQKLCVAVYGKDGADSFRRVKGVLERLFRQTGIIDWSLSREKQRDHLHPGRQARVFVGGKEVGWIGQIDAETSDAFGLDVEVVMTGLNIDELLPMLSLGKSYVALPQFPSVKRDLAFVVDERVEYATVIEAIEQASDLVDRVGLFDVYRGRGIDDGKKSLAVHMNFRSDERTLEAKEVDAELENIRTVLTEKFSAIMRS